jgi:hypothetical protein
LKFYYGFALFLFNSSLYLVASSYFPFFWILFVKFIPLVETGLPTLVPTLPALDGVTLYELGGGLV